MTSGARDLTQGGVARTLVIFALPTLAINILQTLNNTISSIFVGKMLGEAALAASANATMFMFAVFSLVFGFSMAATILIGQAAGRGDWQEVKRTSGVAFGLLGIGGIAGAIAGWFGAPAIMRMLAVPDEVFTLGVDFLRILFIGMPISVVSMVIPSLLRGVGDSTSPLWNTAFNVVLCLILNPLLIPAFGIKGAALAAVLANVLSVTALLGQIYWRRSPIALKGADLRFIKPDIGHAGPLLRMGIPMGLSMVVMGVAQLIVIGLVNREGMQTVAAFGALNQLWNFLQMPAFAVSTAVSAMTAQNIGADRWDRVGSITRSGTMINMVMTGLVLLAMTLLIKPLLLLFLPEGSKAIGIGAHINLLVGWTYVMMGISSVFTSVVRSNGETVAPLLILVASGVLVRFLVAFPLYPAWGADAIWASFAAASLSGALMSLAYYQWGNWRSRRLGGSGLLTREPDPA